MRWFFSLFKKKKPRQIKLGLALGSGGAKGFAELGALRAFEENGIAFDVVAGTSIGSIIGAFYADGYNATDITELIRKIDLGEILNGIMLGMSTEGLYRVLSREIGFLNFEDLKKPFAAIATDADSGEEKVFKTGDVAKALCASSCFIPYFKAVEIDGRKYVDGAYANSIPAGIVKELGADYVVGIDLSTHESRAGFLSKILPSFKKGVEEPWEEGYMFSDVMIHPDLTGFKSTSASSGEAMYAIGYQAATEVIPKILSDVEGLKFPKKKKKK